MRTTIDIPDALFRQVKAAAALEGKTLKSYFTEAIEERLRAGRPKKSESRVSLPLVPSDSPGSLSISNDDLARVLEAEDVRALTRR